MNERIDFRIGFWRLADPKISLASISSIFLGACFAATQGSIDIFWLILTVVGIFAIEVAKNASGEIFDFDSGVDRAVAEKDRSPFSGGKRVLVEEILTRGHVIGIATAGYLVGIAIGLVIYWFSGPEVFWIGMVGVGAAFLYHAPPFKLSYRGFGELAVAVSYGPLICAGTYFVQRGDITIEVVAVSLVLGLLIANFLLINEFPDYHADRSAEKLTLVVRLGRPMAARLYAWTLGLSLLLLLCLPVIGLPLSVWLGLIALPSGISAARMLLRYHEDAARIIPAQAKTLYTFLLFSLGTGVGILFGIV